MNIFKIIGRTYPAFSSPPCNGFFSFLGDIFGGAADVYNSKQNIKLQRETNAQNKQMFYDQLKWQEEQNAITRQYNAQEADWAAWRDQQFSREMFNAENAYNSPEAQMKRFQQAGINPSVAFSGTTTSSGEASSNGVSSSPASSSAPSSPSPPTLVAPQLTYRPSDTLKNIADVIALSSQAKKNLADANATDSITPKQIDLLVKQAFKTEFEAKIAEIEAQIKEKFGEKAAQATIGKDLSESALNMAKGAEAFSSTFLNHTRSFLNKLLGSRYQTENKVWAKKVQNDLDTQEEQIKLFKKQQATEDSKQTLNIKLGNKADSDAISNRVMADAQMINAKSAERVGYSNANYLNQLAKSQENVRNMYDAIKFNNIWQGRYNSARTSIEKQNLKIIKSKITYHEKLGEFNEVRAWIGIFNEFTNAIYGGGRALEQVMSPFTTADEAANMFGVSGNSTFGMPGTTNGYSGTFIF